MYTHDPREHIRGIHQILVSDKKRIGFLFGAGSSFATGLPTAFIPAIEKMTGKKQFAEIFTDYVHKPQGKPTLVLETDKRPVYQKKVSEFDNIQI